MTKNKKENRWFSLELASLVYLAVPWLIFSWGWLRPIAATLATVVLLAGLILSLKKRRPDELALQLRPYQWGLLGLVSLVWVMLSGVGGFGFRNPGVLKIDALLSELISRPWPVAYPDSTLTKSLPLVASLGFLLPSAMVGKLFNWDVAVWFELAWTLSGVMIGLAWFLRLLGKAELKLAFLFILFGGLDVLGASFYWGYLPSGTTHLEWWSRLWQYPSATTSLFWSPQNAIPAWIAAGYLLWLGFVKREPENLVFLLALTLIWSPMIFVGLVPFVVMALARMKFTQAVSIQNGPLALVLLVAGLVYYSAGFSSIHLESPLTSLVLFDYWPTLLIFYLLEFGLYFLLGATSFPDFWKEGKLIFRTMLGFLVLIPILVSGKSNEIFGQAAIPSLFVLSVLVVYQVTVAPPGLKRQLFWLVVFIGLFPALSEIARSFSQPHFYPTNPLEAAQVDRAAFYQEDGLLGSPTSRLHNLLIKHGGSSKQLESATDFLPPGTVAIKPEDNENVTRQDLISDDFAHPGRKVVTFGYSRDDCLTYSFRTPSDYRRARLVLMASTFNPHSELEVHLDEDYLKTVNCRFSGKNGLASQTVLRIGYLKSGPHHLCLQGKGAGIALQGLYVYDDPRDFLLIEAEDYLNTGGPNHLQSLSYASGGKIVDSGFGQSSGDHLDYELNVDSPTRGGTLTVSYATGLEGAVLLASLNGGSFGRVVCPSTHDWFQFNQVKIPLPPMMAGPVSFSVQANGININLDYFIFKFTP